MVARGTGTVAYILESTEQTRRIRTPVTFSPSFENCPGHVSRVQMELGQDLLRTQQVHVTSGMEQVRNDRRTSTSERICRVGKGLGLREGYLENPGVMTLTATRLVRTPLEPGG